jgi:hypothetical protein
MLERGKANSLGSGRTSHAVLLLPLLLFPAQLLAEHGPGMAGAARITLRAAAGVHGLPAIPRKPLALRMVAAATLLPRVPFLARSVLKEKRCPESSRHLFSSFAVCLHLQGLGNRRQQHSSFVKCLFGNLLLMDVMKDGDVADQFS